MANRLTNFISNPGRAKDLLNGGVGAGLAITASLVSGDLIDPGTAATIGFGAGVVADNFKAAAKTASSGLFNNGRSDDVLNAGVIAEQLDLQNEINNAKVLDEHGMKLGEDAVLKHGQTEQHEVNGINSIRQSEIAAREGEIGNGRSTAVAQQGANGAIVAGVKEASYGTDIEKSGLDQSGKDAAKREAESGMKEMTPEQALKQQQNTAKNIQNDASLRTGADIDAAKGTQEGQKAAQDSGNSEKAGSNNFNQNTVGGDQTGPSGITQTNVQGEGTLVDRMNAARDAIQSTEGGAKAAGTLNQASGTNGPEASASAAAASLPAQGQAAEAPAAAPSGP